MKNDVRSMLSGAAALLQMGQTVAAKARCEQILKRFPGSADALHLLGVCHARLGDDAAAERLIGRSLALNPAAVAAYNHRGISLRRLGRADDAIASFRQAVALRGDYAEAWNNLGNAYREAVRTDEALEAFTRALALRPDLAQAHHNRAAVLAGLGRDEEALADLDAALRLDRAYAEAWNLRGVVCARLNRLAEALQAFDAALAADPDCVDALLNQAGVLLKSNRGEDAIAAYRRCTALQLGLPEAWDGLGEALMKARRHAEAAGAFDQLLRLDRRYPYAVGKLLHARVLSCDWSGLDRLCEELGEGVLAGSPAVEPFVYQGLADSEAQLRQCAETYAAREFPALRLEWGEPAAPIDGRIAVGYLCGEFRQQATTILMAGVYERHDRTRFRLIALDNGGADDSDYRRRIENSFDEIVDIRGMSDESVARLVRARGIEVLVNLNGYFGDGRQGVFALKPAPVQVNYLGFPGTLGAPYMDYIVADRTVLPEDGRGAYTEQVVYLPHTYQPNDDLRAIAPGLASREEHGLPQEGFVFCCFNNSYKILPPTFDSWMRILRRVPGSVLWLLHTDPAVASNLRREAEQRGVAPERLVFGRPVPPDEHLRRHRAADLFLDTLPYNAHTTASDALWAGVPVLTRLGTTFAGRVGASLLQAAGLPDLVTRSAAEYEDQAVAIASEPGLLQALRARVRSARGSPLFDTRGITRCLEQAWQAMAARARTGQPPQGFSVPADVARPVAPGPRDL